MGGEERMGEGGERREWGKGGRGENGGRGGEERMGEGGEGKGVHE